MHHCSCSFEYTEVEDVSKGRKRVSTKHPHHMETNKRPQIHSIRRGSGRGLKPLPAIEDAPWLNDVKPNPRLVEASPSFVGVERLETVPLTKLAEAKMLASLEASSTKPPTDKSSVADSLSEAHSLSADDTNALVHQHMQIGPKHPLWGILLRLSKQLWYETYQSFTPTEAMPPAEYVRQRVVTILRTEPSITNAIDSLANAELLFRAVLNEVIGYGPLELLMQDELVSEIIVSGSQHVMIKRNSVLHDTAHSFVDEQHLLRIIENMLRRSGAYSSIKKPLIDIVLPPSLVAQTSTSPTAHATSHALASTFLATIILPPVSLGGPILMLRRRARKNVSLSELIEQGTLSQAMADVLLTCVKEHRSIFICGERATGKTTILNALADFIAEQERIVSVENVSELILQQKHVSSLVATNSSPAMARGAAQVTVSEVLHHALLLCPAYLLLGECRGDEARILLRTMYHGQRGIMTTLYADSIRDCLERLEQQYQHNSENVTVELARKQLADTLDIIVFLAKEQNEVPKIQNIAKVIGVEKRRIKVQSLFYNQQAIVELAEGSSIEHS